MNNSLIKENLVLSSCVTTHTLSVKIRFVFMHRMIIYNVNNFTIDSMNYGFAAESLVASATPPDFGPLRTVHSKFEAIEYKVFRSAGCGRENDSASIYN